MPQQEILQFGSTSKTIYFEIKDKTSTPVGMPLSGLVFNTAGLAISYIRNGVKTAISLVTLATADIATTPWATGGFKEIGASGTYRLDLPNAVIAAGATKAFINITGANSVDENIPIDLVPYDPNTSDVSDIWNALTSGMTTAGSVGKKISDSLTGDIFARLGAPAGANIAADILAIQLDIIAIKNKVNHLPNVDAGLNGGLPIGDGSGRVAIAPNGLDAIAGKGYYPAGNAPT